MMAGYITLSLWVFEAGEEGIRFGVVSEASLGPSGAAPQSAVSADASTATRLALIASNASVPSDVAGFRSTVADGRSTASCPIATRETAEARVSHPDNTPPVVRTITIAKQRKDQPPTADDECRRLIFMFIAS